MRRLLQPVLLSCLVGCCWWFVGGREAHLDVHREDRGRGRSLLARLDAVAPTVYMERDGQKTGLLALSKALRAALGTPEMTHALMAAAGGVLCDLLLSGGHRRCRAPAEQPSQKAQQQQPWLLAAAAFAAFLVGLCVPVLLALLRQLRCRWSLPAAEVECQLPKVAPAPEVELLSSTPRVTSLPTPLRNGVQSSPSRRSPMARSSDESPWPFPAEDEDEEEDDEGGSPPSPASSEDSWHAATSSQDGDGESDEVTTRLLEAKQVRRSFPLSRSEKQLQLYQVLDQERQAAVQESRRLRGAASDAAQRLLAAAVGN